MKPAKARDIVVKPISAQSAAAVVKAVHYSGKVVNNSQIHFGVFLDGRLLGAMSFGASMDKRKTMALVAGTKWNGFLELNRMAFSDLLPKNSESRALGVALRLIRKTYPGIEWIISFADGTQCGDGTIYRATGFVLTGIRKNASMIRMPDGSVVCKKTLNNKNNVLKLGGYQMPAGAEFLPGYQLRYVYFLNPAARARLTVAEIPYSKIAEVGASMYKGKRRAASIANDASGSQPEEGGATPTAALQPTCKPEESP